MYTPKHFCEDNASAIRAVVEAAAFSPMITQRDGQLNVSHLLFVPSWDAEGRLSLFGHMARANEQWRDLEAGAEALVIFQGPHAYISPRYYRSTYAVPTWNYAVVHASGTARMIDDPAVLRDKLDRLVAAHEPPAPDGWATPWQDERYEKLLDGIVGFDIEVTDLQAKFKLNQNRPIEDQLSVIDALKDSPRPDERAVVELMRANVEASS